jgi:formate hydrogenlyase subunit 3/multisubunit Na+/H+ antiporter MnhD subunit
MNADSLPLLVFLPFSASLLCLLDRLLRRRPLLARAASAASTASSLLLLGLLLPGLRAQGTLACAVGGWLEPLGIVLYLDALAWTASLMGSLVALCALLFAFGEGGYRSDFYFFFLMLLAGMEGVILTGDLFNMFVFLEILSISSYLLIAYSLRGASLWASLRYLLLSSLGIVFFLFGLFLVYRSAGSFSLRLISAGAAGRAGAGAAASSGAAASAGAAARALRLAAGVPASQTLHLAAAALTVGVGLKAAFVPLHTWLPAAHAAAPHPVSALLSGVMIKISFLAVWRILAALGATGIQALFLWLGPLTALLGVLLALAQTDGKRLLAYHSVSQMGLIAAAYGAAARLGTPALTASLAHILSHSLFKSLLFLSVGAVIHLGGRRNLGDSSRDNPRPWLIVFFVVGAAAIAGLPPLNGFVSKTLVGSLFKGAGVLGIAIRLTAVGTAASMIKLSALFRGPGGRKGKRGAAGKPKAAPQPSDAVPCSAAAAAPAAAAPAGPAGISAPPPVEEPQRPRLSPFCIAALVLLALLCLAGGVFPRLMLGSLVAPAVAGAGQPAVQAASEPPAGGAALPAAYRITFYTPRHLLEAVAAAGLGALLYLLVRSRSGGRAAAALRGLRLSLDGALLLVAAAVLLFTVLG